MSYSLSDFGSYRAGGRLVEVSGEPCREIAFTASTRYPYDPNGAFPVESAYVQYFVPSRRRDRPPVVLLHGGGMTGAMWETTPDGRPGWLHLLLDRGLEVHVVDNVERGRAGWKPGLWPGEPILRSLQEAWRLFRFGRPEDFAARRAFPNQQFPVARLEDFGRGFVPRWTSSGPAQVAAFEAVLRRLGRATVICHSQGGEAAFEAAARAPEAVERLIALEPSGFAERPELLAGVPVVLARGDYLDCDATWRGLTARWRDFAAALRGAGGSVAELDLADGSPGVSHMAMMDRGSADHLDRLPGL
ncbi:hypothetical protein SAMN06265365_116119 [Tistlia consotensis]|uniref:Alpha/beta hydrolase family protein n=1 Tax=Tistlia consotensis USBA 355 TaxID=560819 RepID=A0A1Y6C7W5_9PROT|nr:alpha/beta fold hydrolase [Tistlia consotensis]SMF47660.1 hypothetical protein SAMN05428998_11718 [Tistlia consotensis USBA 355]SNR82220.1 hypothetical protein SAMN06265365_116119 [Tistlia consotensis]